MENPAQDIHQSYDTFVKAFFRSEMDTLVSHFLKGATLEEAEQNVEIDRSMLKIYLSLLDQVSAAASHSAYRATKWPR